MENKRLYEIPELRKIIPMSRAGIYQAVKNGEIPSVFIGRRRFVPAWYVDKLVNPPSEQGA